MTNKKLNIEDKRINNGSFTTKPHDVLKIIIDEGVVSSSIRFELSNTESGDEFHPYSFPNNPRAWQYLKDLNEIPNRTVTVYNERDDETVPFERSAPYIHRFR